MSCVEITIMRTLCICNCIIRITTQTLL